MNGVLLSDRDDLVPLRRQFGKGRRPKTWANARQGLLALLVLWVAFAGTLVVARTAPAAEEGSLPNIVLILADDKYVS